MLDLTRRDRLGRDLLDRLEDKFVVGDGCWPWTGAKVGAGYGAIEMGGRHQMKAHRVLYELLVGPIPNGFDLDHLCHNADPTCTVWAECPHHACVRPSHLEPVTSRENTLRGKSVTAMNAAKVVCKCGEPYDGVSQTNGQRLCSACRKRATVRFNNKQRKRGDLVHGGVISPSIVEAFRLAQWQYDLAEAHGEHPIGAQW